MSTEEEHAYASGYEGARGVRSWRERMRILETNGFIRVKAMANRRYAYVLLVHPEAALDRLRAEKRVPDAWWEAYRDRRLETGETAVAGEAEEPVATIAGALPAAGTAVASPTSQAVDDIPF
ncbi:MAG: hypothetical protein ACREMQ_01005, partial [Longimicrobiales bacterium]